MITAYYQDRSNPEHTAHFHAAFELLYVAHGWVEIEVGNTSMRADAPSLVFFGHLEAHRVAAESPEYARYVLTIPTEALRGLPPSVSSIFRSRPIGFRHVLPCAFPIEHIFAKIVHERSHADALTEIYLENMVRLLLMDIYRYAPEAFPAGKETYPEGIVAAQHYMDAHFRENISMEDVAKLVYMSPSYFRHLFCRLIGLSPKQYVMRSRLAYARECLETTSMPIHEIAELCCFPDASNFSRRFQAQYGISPRDIRRK